MLLVTPPNSYRIAAYLGAARALGIAPVVASPGRHSLIGELAAGVHIDLHDPAAGRLLLAAAARQPFDGVVATDDAAVQLASEVAATLGLPHNPPLAARLSRRKDLARACLQQAGVPVPAHRRIELDRPLAPQLEGLRYPVVVKPVSLSASRGVLRADDPAACRRACARIEAMLAREQDLPAAERRLLLIEAFVEGPELAVEALLHEGELELLAVFDKPDPLQGPCFEETYYVTPSRHDPRDLALAVGTVARACRAYGLREGPVHAELRLARGQAWVMEVASRTIGGECARLLRFGAGADLETLVLQRALGRPVEVQPPEDAAGVLMLPIPGAGVLRRVEGVLAARRVPYIEELILSVREGYELVPLPEGGSYLGFLFARAPTPAQAEAALREAHDKLKVVIAPLFSIQQT
ncbi:MAG TPA: ATP-grasp domain-containing protein, partial [Gammaproteobacteria bacterium]|nr:ATP-grasp domain-containing protein [Gammaproteobacteria bacterium]